MEPTYFPNSKRTRELFGCTIINPGAIKIAVNTAKTGQGLRKAIIEAMPPKKNNKNTNNIR